MLILDKATSNLDLKTEALVERALDTLIEGRTAILIAHRLSTAMRANRIAVVDAGRIVELGSHEQLLAQAGQYATLFEMWQRQPRAERIEAEGSRYGCKLDSPGRAIGPVPGPFDKTSGAGSFEN